MPERDYSLTDRLLMRLHERLSQRLAMPAAPRPRAGLGDDERQRAAGLMRVNHAGEIAAQALYRGQALTARDPKVRSHLLQAAAEEQQHLRWCEERLKQLGSRPSRLRPLWSAGSFAIGAAAGLAGDRWSLGFVAETEKQVGEHLQDHLQKLPPADRRSRDIVQKMHEDETRHGRAAQAAGGRALPAPVRGLMRGVAGIMKLAAYRF